MKEIKQKLLLFAKTDSIITEMNHFKPEELKRANEYFEFSVYGNVSKAIDSYTNQTVVSSGKDSKYMYFTKVTYTYLKSKKYINGELVNIEKTEYKLKI
jgi:hypothetical protein